MTTKNEPATGLESAAGRGSCEGKSNLPTIVALREATSNLKDALDTLEHLLAHYEAVPDEVFDGLLVTVRLRAHKLLESSREHYRRQQ